MNYILLVSKTNLYKVYYLIETLKNVINVINCRNLVKEFDIIFLRCYN